MASNCLVCLLKADHTCESCRQRFCNNCGYKHQRKICKRAHLITDYGLRVTYLWGND